MKRLLPFLFMFMLIGTVFAAMPVHAARSTYTLKIYDSQGRYLDPWNPNIYRYAAVRIDKVGYLWSTHIGTYQGKGATNNISFSTDGDRIQVTYFWMGNPVWNTEVPLTTSELKVQMPITPAVPITTYQTEAIGVSSDLHEISTKFYDVMFGTGENQDHIQVKIGGNTYNMPVTLTLNYNSNSDTKPFRFLAQNPDHPVEGEDKFLIWTTAKYWSSVKTEKVGDNMLLVVWTYGYTDVAGAWRDKVIAAIAAGAVMGALTGPEGALAGGTIAGWATAIAWAVNPELVDLSAHTGIGVVVGLFTPRYFQIQGVGGFGANGTKGTVTISNIPQSGRATWSGTSYEIYSETNTLQVGFTKDWGSIHKSDFYDMETYSQAEEIIRTSKFGGTGGQTSQTAHSGQYSYYLSKEWAAIKNIIIHVPKGAQLKVDFDGWIRKGGSGYYSINAYEVKGDISTQENANNNLTAWGGTPQKSLPSSWTHIHESFTKIADRDVNITLGFTTITGSAYFDDFQFSWTIIGGGAYRYIFDTSQQDTTGSVVRYMFGTIPVIAPSSQGGTPIHNRYTLIAIDMARQDGALAVDWASRLVTLSPARLMIKSDTWTETGWLLGTDDKDGFKDVNFTIVNPKWFVYRVDFMTYYYFTTPGNWTVKGDWSPLMANNTTIYIPNWYPGGWDVMSYNMQAWWNNLPLWWKMFVAILPLIIIGLILLIVAPWVIVALIKGIAMIFKGLVKGIGAAGKALSGRKRRG